MKGVNRISILAMIACVALLSLVSKADVAPPPGFSRVANGLELRPVDDLKAFRFFLEDAAGTLEEILISENDPVVIDGSGRGGPAAYGTVWAISADSLESGDLSEDQIAELGIELGKRAAAGQVLLIKHDFREEVSVFRSGGEHRQTYEVGIDKKTGKPFARPLTAGTGIMSGRGLGLLAAAAIGSMVILTCAGVVFWLLRKRSSRSKQ